MKQTPQRSVPQRPGGWGLSHGRGLHVGDTSSHCHGELLGSQGPGVPRAGEGSLGRTGGHDVSGGAFFCPVSRSSHRPWWSRAARAWIQFGPGCGASERGCEAWASGGARQAWRVSGYRKLPSGHRDPLQGSGNAARRRAAMGETRCWDREAISRLSSGPREPGGHQGRNCGDPKRHC